MTGTFKASNGIDVTNLGGNWDRTTIRFEGTGIEYRRAMTFEATDLEAFRECELARRDEELGRWRWPDNPDYVVYPLDEFGQTIVFRESTGHNITFLRGQVNTQGSAYARCALAFFEAHPERKPWEDAKPGEVWLIGSDTNEIPAIVTDGGLFRFADGSRIPASELFVTARRVWPEDAS